MVKEHLFTWTVISFRVSGRTILPQETELTLESKEENIQVTGKMTNQTVLVFRNGLMAICLREILKMVRNTAKEFLFGMMAHLIKGNGIEGWYRVLEYINIKTEGSMWASGVKTWCMDRAHTNGETAENILETMKTTWKVVGDSIVGQTGESTKDTGNRESVMEKVWWFT